jgi:peroxiredoxin
MEGDERMKKKKNVLMIIAMWLAGLCLLACGGMVLFILFEPQIYQFSLDQSSLKVGTPAPDFELRALNGETLRLSQFRGRPVLLNFGATWCPDCRAETPQLQELHTSHPELNIILVDSKEDADTVQKFVDEFRITYPILLDTDGATSDLYRIFAIPTGLFIDAEGIIRAKVIENVTPQLLSEKLPLIGIEP